MKSRYSNETQVSTRSLFGESKWSFNEETGRARCVIHWNWSINSKTTFGAIELTSFRLALKQFAFALIKGWSAIAPRIHPQSTKSLVDSLRHFIRFLFIVQNKTSFAEVSPTDYRQFFEAEIRANRSLRQITRAMAALSYLVNERKFIDEEIRLEVRPPPEMSKLYDRSRQANRGRKTKKIPDAVLRRAWEIALDYLLECAPYILKIRKKELEFRRMRDSGEMSFRKLRSAWGNGWDSSSASYSKSYFAKLIERLEVPSKSKVLPNGVRDANHYVTALLNLRRAAIFVLGISTGVRISTLSTFTRNCVRKGTGRNGQKILWIKGRLFKMADDPRGLPAEWVCGEYGALAAQILHDWAGRRYKLKRLISAVSPHVVNGVAVGDDSGMTAQEAIEDVAKFFSYHRIMNDDGTIWHFTAHQMRVTFVYLVCVHANTPLDVLQGHLGHLNMYMTDYYLGTDPGLWMEYYEAVYEYTRLRVSDALSEPFLAGAGGEKIAAEIDRAIERGALPQEFRGHAGETIRLKIAEDFIRSGQRVYFLDTNFCRFRPKLAVCNPGGKEPLAHLCHPLKCKNATIAAIHAPAWAALSQSIKKASEKYRRSTVLRPHLRAQAAVADAVLKKISRNTQRHAKKAKLEAISQTSVAP